MNFLPLQRPRGQMCSWHYTSCSSVRSIFLQDLSLSQPYRGSWLCISFPSDLSWKVMLPSSALRSVLLLVSRTCQIANLKMFVMGSVVVHPFSVQYRDLLDSSLATLPLLILKFIVVLQIHLRFYVRLRQIGLNYHEVRLSRWSAHLSVLEALAPNPFH